MRPWSWSGPLLVRPGLGCCCALDGCKYPHEITTVSRCVTLLEIEDDFLGKLYGNKRGGMVFTDTPDASWAPMVVAISRDAVLFLPRFRCKGYLVRRSASIFINLNYRLWPAHGSIRCSFNANWCAHLLTEDARFGVVRKVKTQPLRSLADMRSPGTVGVVITFSDDSPFFRKPHPQAGVTVWMWFILS